MVAQEIQLPHATIFLRRIPVMALCAKKACHMADRESLPSCEVTQRNTLASPKWWFWAEDFWLIPNAAVSKWFVAASCVLICLDWPMLGFQKMDHDTPSGITMKSTNS